MQIALKSWLDFTKSNINQLATETTRLQLAGIESFAVSPGNQCMSFNSTNADTLVETITDKVVEKLQEISLNNPMDNTESLNVNFVDNRFKMNPQAKTSIITATEISAGIPTCQ